MQNNHQILVVNAGSSSIKFTLFENTNGLHKIYEGSFSQIGNSRAIFCLKKNGLADHSWDDVEFSDYDTAIDILTNWVVKTIDQKLLVAIGHRIVHGGTIYHASEQITLAMVAELERISLFDPDHLPKEIKIIKAFTKVFPRLPQIACFDTAFHHDMPRVAQIVAIPRKYEAEGVRRYGFHGVSYSFIVEELGRLDPLAARGRAIIAHLGSGASIAAVVDGKSVDTTMSFTPASGIPMSTRSGDLDPGLASYFSQMHGMSPRDFNYMVNEQSGLLGISETTSDMYTLISHEESDVRAAEAVNVFCYQIKKTIGAFAASMGGIDTVVFAGGIGENSSIIRARICQGLEFLGIKIDEDSNGIHAPIISAKDAQVTVRVIHTDEEMMIAKDVRRVLSF